MNQILVTNDKEKAQVTLMKPVIKFFCILAIIFALVLVGEGVYNLYKNLNKDGSYPRPTLIQEIVGSDMEIRISNEVGISKVFYSWNDGEQMEYKGEGRKIINFEIAVPQGENTLNVAVVDIQGNKTRFEGIKAVFTESKDSKKPKISIEKNDEKLIITAIDETEMAYLTYQWDDGEKVKTEVSDEDKKEIVQEIDIEKGEKKLTMVAVDRAGNKETLTKKISNKDESYVAPVLTTKVDGNKIKINISGNVKINEVKCVWNGKDATLTYTKGQSNISMELDIPEGDNKLNISIVDDDGITTKFDEVTVRAEGTKDTTKPQISVENVAPKLVITATDETELDYMTYQWEDGEKVNVEAKGQDKKTIKQEVNVEKGTKTITITAVDKSGNIETEKKKILGSNGAEIKVTFSDGNFVVKVTDEYAITKIQYTLNDEEYTVEDIPANAKEYEFRVPLKDGETNYLKIDAYENDLLTEYKCKKTL